MQQPFPLLKFSARNQTVLVHVRAAALFEAVQSAALHHRWNIFGLEATDPGGGVVHKEAADGVVLVDANEVPDALKGVKALAIPATKIAHNHGLKFSNVVMLGAAAAAGGIPLANIQDAAVKKLGKRLDADSLRGAIAEGYACLA